MTREEADKAFPAGTRVHFQIGRGQRQGSVQGISDKGKVQIKSDKGDVVERNPESVKRA